VPDAEVVAVYSRSLEKAQAFAGKHGIKSAYDDIQSLLLQAECDVVDICLPNFLHYDMCLAAANAGKHIIIEKPLCLSLEQADEMIAVCKYKGRLLMYAEELCFAPKYERVRAIVESGAVGDIYELRQCEKHSGPHSRWFYQSETAGGGVMMDMGCHSIEVIRWLYDKPAIQSVTAELGTFVHGDRTDLEDHALVTIRFEGDRLGFIETSWAKPGGMDDSLDIQGSAGTCHGDMMAQSSLFTYSDVGYGYSVEKGTTKGYSYTIAEEYYNYGMPQEMQHFTDCVLEDREPMEDGADGRVGLEVIYAAYRSAAKGQRVPFPLELSSREAAEPPYRLWK
jgi:predicted dehydrogenase